MCKCKVCSDKQGYEELMRELSNALQHKDIDYQAIGKITRQLDEYEAYYYMRSEPVSVFLYNGGEELIYEEYERNSVERSELHHFNYCPRCGRKLD